MMGAFGPLNFLRSYVYGVDFDAEHEQAMAAHQRNTWQAEQQANAQRAAKLEQCSDVMRIAVAAETTYVVEESKQLPVHEQEQSS